MTNDTPEWPDKKTYREFDAQRDPAFLAYVDGSNTTRAACISAFEEWKNERELKELDEEEIYSYFAQLFGYMFTKSELSGAEMNCTEDDAKVMKKLAKEICQRFGVRRELEELDEDGLYGFLLSLSGDLRFAYIYKGQEGGDPARDVAKAICQRFGVRKNKACPCKHTEPCQDDCTCVNALSSKGCLRCCTYGNKEQQLKTAQRLVAFIDRPKVPTVEDIRKTMIRAEHGAAAFTTTKHKMDVLNKQAEAVHRLITEGGEG